MWAISSGQSDISVTIARASGDGSSPKRGCPGCRGSLMNVGEPGMDNPDTGGFMSNLAAGEAAGVARGPEPGDAYLSHWNALAEQRHWLLPTDRDMITIGRAASTDVCL